MVVVEGSCLYVYLFKQGKLPWHLELHLSLLFLKHLQRLSLQPDLQLHLTYPCEPVTAVLACASLIDMDVVGTSSDDKKAS